MLPANANSHMHGSKGFTLIETMIAVALSGIISYMVFSSLYTTKNLFNKSISKTEAIQQIRYTMATISKDVQNVLRTDGVSFVGVDRSRRSDGNSFEDNDCMYFSTISKIHINRYKDSGSVDTVKFLLDNGGTGNSSFLKREVFSDYLPHEVASRTLASEIMGLNFRYLKDNKWYNVWNRKSLPNAVEITIKTGNRWPKSLPNEFKTTVSIVL